MEGTLVSLLLVTLAVCALSDARARLIPDVVTWPAWGLALGVRWLFEGVGDLEHGLLSGLAASAGVVALFGGVAWFNRGFGWGDVKLLGVVGACLGSPQILVAVMFVAVVGAVQAVIAVIWQDAGGDTVRRMLGSPSNSSATRRHIPYGVAIAVGSAWAVWWGHAT